LWAIVIVAKDQASDFAGDVVWNIGIFQPTADLWAIKEVIWAYFGGRSDIPVTR